MPIFSKNFSKKSTHVRESRLVEDIDDFKNLVIKLSDKNTLKFVGGEWLVIKKNLSSDNADDVSELVKYNLKLKEENNMMSVKMDILLDLLSETLRGGKELMPEK